MGHRRVARTLRSETSEMRCSATRFEGEESALDVDAAAEADHRAVGADDAVTGITIGMGLSLFAVPTARFAE
ncbi:MAG: hypothetical protein QOK37_2408 [Thermoanaerobaculia bacterium]|nr:hypothetical protein [Thermoanaerobaculia bacterium]